MALTEKQQRFVDEYLVDLNAAAAARRAGYSAKTADRTGHKLLHNAEVASLIADAKQERSARTQITQDDVLNRIASFAFADLADFASWGEDGELVLIASAAVDAEKLPALREVRSTTSTVVFKDGGERTTVYKAVKLHDPIRALELLGKHLGIFNDNALPDGPITVELVWPEQATG